MGEKLGVQYSKLTSVQNGCVLFLIDVFRLMVMNSNIHASIGEKSVSWKPVQYFFSGGKVETEGVYSNVLPLHIL